MDITLLEPAVSIYLICSRPLFTVVLVPVFLHFLFILMIVVIICSVVT